MEYDNCLDEPTEPIKEGYDFLGWYIGNTKFDFLCQLHQIKNYIWDGKWTVKH